MTNIGEYAFRDCISLTSVQLPESIIEISSFAFYGCSNLENINIPRRTKILGSSVFAQCIKLKLIILPESVRWIGSRLYYIWVNHQSYVNNLESVINESVVPQNIPKDCFEDIWEKQNFMCLHQH